MAYDSPKTIRRRQQARNDAPPRTRQPQPVKVASQEEWDRACDFHLNRIHEHINAGARDSANRHARALVTMAVYRKAAQLMQESGLREAWNAVRIARVELLGREDD